MRHATEADLDQIDVLLARLRAVEGITEPKRGKFQHRSRALVHFHEDAGAIYADIRHPHGWERRPVGSPTEDDALVREAESLLTPPR